MQTSTSDLAKENEAPKNAPGIYQVLGAAILDVAILLFGWFFLMFLAMAIWTLVEFISHGIKPDAQPGPLALLLISMPALYLAILGLSFFRGRRLAFQPVPSTNARLLFFSLSAGFVLFLLTTLSTYVLTETGAALKPANQALLEDLGTQWPIAIGFFAVVVAPIFEELLFRKQLFGRFAGAGYIVTGYILSSLLFALMHEPLPTQGIASWLSMLAVYGAMGAVFAWVYKKTGRLWPAIIAHACNNFFAVSALFLASSLS